MDTKGSGKSDKHRSPHIRPNTVKTVALIGGTKGLPDVDYKAKYNALKVEFRKVHVEVKDLRAEMQKQKHTETQYLYLLSNNQAEEGEPILKLIHLNSKLEEETKLLKAEMRKLISTVADLANRNYKLEEKVKDTRETIQICQQTRQLTSNIIFCDDQFEAAVDNAEKLKNEVREIKHLKGTLVRLVKELKDVVGKY